MLEKNIDLNGKTILVTGAAGFIGANLCRKILEEFENVLIVGIDNLNDYYDVSLKEYRLEQIRQMQRQASVSGEFVFFKGNLADKEFVETIFGEHEPEIVVNLAAQAGVRYSIANPDAYIEANVLGFYNVLEACRYSYGEGRRGVEHLIYASSSSVYGSNKKIPYSTDDKVDHPVSLYAATKKSNELFAHAYSKLYGIPSTGLRFFTVYGPAGRPDMAYFGFTEKLVKNEKIKIFNYGNCKRDFTYINDIVKGIVEVIQRCPFANEDGVRYKVYNIGNNRPENLLDFVEILKDELKKAEILPEDYDLREHMELVGMQPGDVEVTYADVDELEKDFGFKPSTSLREGLGAFVQWYREYGYDGASQVKEKLAYFLNIYIQNADIIMKDGGAILILGACAALHSLQYILHLLCWRVLRR